MKWRIPNAAKTANIELLEDGKTAHQMELAIRRYKASQSKTIALKR